MTLAARLMFRWTAAGLSLSALLLPYSPIAGQDLKLPPKTEPTPPDKGTTIPEPGKGDPKNPTAEKPPEKPILQIVEEALNDGATDRRVAALSLLNQARFESETSGGVLDPLRLDVEKKRLTAIEDHLRQILTGESIASEPKLQAAALTALGRVATEKDVPQLKSIFKAGLESADPAVRKGALEGLINFEFQGGEAIPRGFTKAQGEVFPLGVPLVNDSSPEVSNLAVEFVDNLVNLDKLRTLIRDVIKDLNDSSTSRLDIIRDIEERQKPEALKDQSTSLNVAGDVVTPLIATVRTGSIDRKRKALLLLRNYTLSRRMLRNLRSFDVRSFRFDESNVSALPADLDPLAKQLHDAQPVLADVLRSSDEPSRRYAAEIFENLSPGAGEQLPAILASLDDTSKIVRWISTRTLGLYAGRDGASPDTIISRLSGALTDTELEVRVAAANSLRRFGASAHSAVPALLRAMTYGDSYGRSAAMLALVATKADPSILVPALVANLDSPLVGLREGAIRALGQLGPVASAALPRLKRSLNDPDATVRIEAARAILAIDAEKK